MTEPSLTELVAEAHHAADRVALQRQKLYAGRGDARRLAELERAAAGAAQRLRAHEQRLAGEHAGKPGQAP